MPEPDVISRHAIVEHVRAALANVLDREPDQNIPLEDTRLVGRDAALDSLGLVTLLIDLEERLRDAYRVDISLTHERALSRTHSPFLNVGRLADYTLELLTSGAKPAA